MNETTINNSIGQLIEPEPIGYSFNTPGWYFVLGLLILTALVIALLQYRKHKKNAYRREAVSQIEALIQQKNENLVFEINTLLKTKAMHIFGRKKVAALYGSDWFTFLQSKLKTTTNVPRKNFEEYSKAIYNSDYKLNEQRVNEFVEFTIIWIRNHRVNV
jgi:hypothetical protein